MPVLPSFHGNETCGLKQLAGASLLANRVRSEIFGFETHKSMVKIAVICCGR